LHAFVLINNEAMPTFTVLPLSRTIPENISLYCIKNLQLIQQRKESFIYAIESSLKVCWCAGHVREQDSRATIVR